MLFVCAESNEASSALDGATHASLSNLEKDFEKSLELFSTHKIFSNYREGFRKASQKSSLI
jgi:hypothetical protein